MKRDFKGVWMPKELWLSKEIKALEKMFLLEIIRLERIEKFSAYNHFSALFNISTGRVSQIFSGLIELKFIAKKKLTDQAAYIILNKGNDLGCLFCGYENSYLDKHHYPIRNKDNGTETIDLCANCHREFHFLTDIGVYEILRTSWDEH